MRIGACGHSCAGAGPANPAASTQAAAILSDDRCMVSLPVVLPTIFDYAAALCKQGMHLGMHLQHGLDEGSGWRLT
jgi:hypothetical protein